MILKANQIYKHFKGNLYRIITIAKHSETEEDMVVYQALYGEYAVYTRPLASFTERLDKIKYPNAAQEYRFEPVEELVEPLLQSGTTNNVERKIESVSTKGTEQNAEPVSMEATGNRQYAGIETQQGINKQNVLANAETVTHKEVSEVDSETETTVMETKESLLDPMLEAYLDTDSYRERLNILHGLQHRITEHMLLTMAVVIDFELPEGNIQEKYDALHDCLLTRERYECNRMV